MIEIGIEIGTGIGTGIGAGIGVLGFLGEAQALGSLHPRLPSLWLTLALGYLGVGAALAWHLGRRGHGLGTATTALMCWPLLLGLIGRPPPQHELHFSTPTEPGPNRGRIDACMATLRRGFLGEDHDQSVGLVDGTQLAKLGHSLHRADLRIAKVDRLLLETEAQRRIVDDAQLEAAIAGLRRARDHAHQELDAVLSGLLSLRVQLGLFTLAGESEPVRERLAELEARVAALAELSSIELAQERS